MKKRRGERPVFKGRCLWRKRVGKAPKALYGLRAACLLVFGLEAAAFYGRIPTGDRPRIGVVSSHEEYRIEWVLPPQLPGAGEGEAYGIRIRPEDWELEFYHSRESIRPEA